MKEIFVSRAENFFFSALCSWQIIPIIHCGPFYYYYHFKFRINFDLFFCHCSYFLSVIGGQHVGSVCPTLASVHGASPLRPAFTLLLISQSSPMGSAETGMTGKLRLSYIFYKMGVFSYNRN